MTKFQFAHATLGVTLFLATSIAFGAAESAGQTANGCNYSVINGKYLYDCSNTAKTTSPTTPVDSYSNVPLVSGKSPTVVSRPASAEKTIEKHDSVAALAGKADTPFVSQSYFGFLAGSMTLTAASAGKSAGLGLTLGSNLDDFTGIELNYAYTTQDINLDLASRSSIPGSNIPATDSSLNAHLLSAELQLHATELTRPIRPFVSVGPAWKRSSLEDLGQGGFAGNAAIAGSKISQSSFGATSALGCKVRFSENFQGIIDFRYFLPIIDGQVTVNPGRLTEADSPLTKSSLYELQVGLLYHF